MPPKFLSLWSVEQKAEKGAESSLGGRVRTLSAGVGGAYLSLLYSQHLEKCLALSWCPPPTREINEWTSSSPVWLHGLHSLASAAKPPETFKQGKLCLWPQSVPRQAPLICTSPDSSNVNTHTCWWSHTAGADCYLLLWNSCIRVSSMLAMGNQV